MRVYKNIEELEINKPVATIGMFDGVHKGHMEIIKNLMKTADKIRGETVLLSFWPHPRMIFEGNKSLRLLSTMDEKVQLLRETGLDHFVIIPFNREFANLSYKSFVKDFLVKKLKINTLIVGHDHQFGKDREGNYEKLLELGNLYHFKVEQLDAQLVQDEMVSSSVIRDALQDGNIERANEFLGYNYNFTGFIVEGKRNGRSIGFPTANIFISETYKSIPGTGVYAVKAKMEGHFLNGMMNIGFRPTIVEDNKQMTIEVHLFGIDRDLYGKEITIYMIKKVRDEKKFKSVAELKTQLQEDERRIRKFLSEIY